MVDHFEEGGYPAGSGGVSEGTHLRYCHEIISSIEQRNAG